MASWIEGSSRARWSVSGSSPIPEKARSAMAASPGASTGSKMRGGGGVTLLGLEAVRQHGCDILEGEVHQQPGQQPVALAGEGQLVVEVDDVVVGEQMAGLELDEGGRDHEELTGDLEIEFAHEVEIVQVLVD